MTDEGAVAKQDENTNIYHQTFVSVQSKLNDNSSLFDAPIEPIKEKVI